jgi:hypothetical protein
MNISTNPDARLWEHQPRRCFSPAGGMLTWYSSSFEGRLRRHMYRLGNTELTDHEGERMRVEWGGTPD